MRKRLERQGLPSSTGTPAPISSDSVPAFDATALQAQLENGGEGPTNGSTPALPDVRELDENLDTAFQLAMIRGPLCAEPVIGMAYFVESVSLNKEEMTIEQGE